MLEKSTHWDESIPEPDEPVFNAMLVIAVQLGPNWFQAVGTGFVIAAFQNYGVALSAAHVFDEIHQIQNPKQKAKKPLSFL